MLEPRDRLTPDVLASLAQAAGLDLSAAQSDALLGPSRAIFAAVDALDTLDLDETEPAAVFRLAQE